MSISLTKDGISSSATKLTFTDGTNSIYIHSNNVIETKTYYFIDGYRFDKSKSILIEPIVVRSTSTSTNGTATLNLLTNSVTGSSNITIEAGSPVYLTAFQKVLSLKNFSYSYKLMYSSVAYNSTVGTNEKNTFKGSGALSSSSYSLSNKAPVVETPGSGSVTLSFNAANKTVSITSNKKPNWSLVGIYVTLS